MILIIGVVVTGICGFTIYQLTHQRSAGAETRSRAVRGLRAGAYLLPGALVAALGATLYGAGHLIMHVGPHLFPHLVTHMLHSITHPTA